MKVRIYEFLCIYMYVNTYEWINMLINIDDDEVEEVGDESIHVYIYMYMFTYTHTCMYRYVYACL
jgi:hypothetical protein